MDMIERRHFLTTLVAAAGAASVPQWAQAQTAYPNKPVRVIVPFAAGGTTDVVARLVMQKMGELMKGTFVIDNRGGANGMIGTGEVARAQADGYTLLFNTAGAQTLSPVIYKAPYEAAASFAPVAKVCSVGFIIIARKDLPANSLQELIALAQNKDKPLTASSGSAIINLITEQFKQVIKAPHIINAQYKGTSPQMQAVVSGEVDFSFDSFAAVEMIKAGKVKALAVVLPQRAASFPDVPTLVELGIKDMEFSSWAGLLAPKGTPKEIVAALSQNIDKVMQMPDVLAKLKQYDYIPVKTTPEVFAQQIQAETDRWKQVVKETGFKLE
ncbi:tripartite-type tricarboxylate transporter receptor subunit TctC [Comamonas sp. BIGb0152]|uniref:Bug family tripartite tricarboxylate transporter substrate binding protein n=1 Tax=Comamonas sp. BIGb0152 TaxID=2940601 RepID=UPI00216709F9|nr:tripartite tricarboxylate transporter substrate binding protein [Comamonas sp. BIGb0152]MCS4293899.1 tripartite-type tricarboxylate transporter receptor subunit TctC [Comamonas sp. BIGb0152]